MNSVLQVKDLSVAFGFDKNGKPRDGMTPLQVTDRVSFEINAGEFFALVGESGCGKSVTAMSILRLLPWPGAQIVEGLVLLQRCGCRMPLPLTLQSCRLRTCRKFAALKFLASFRNRCRR